VFISYSLNGKKAEETETPLDFAIVTENWK
jgi:hypothetical protein